MSILLTKIKNPIRDFFQVRKYSTFLFIILLAVLQAYLTFHFRNYVLKIWCVFLFYPRRHTTFMLSFSFPKYNFGNIVHFFWLSCSLHYEHVMFFVFKKHFEYKLLMEAYIHYHEIIILHFLSNVNTFLKFL